MNARAAGLLTCALGVLPAAPCLADWRDVPDVKGVCSSGCDNAGASSRSEREYIPPAPTPGSIAYGHGQAADRYREAGDWAAAEGEYRTALETDRNSFNGSIYSYQLGYVLLMQDRFSEAETALRGSLRAREYAYARDNLAFVLQKLGRPDDAKQEYLAAIRQAPWLSDAQNRLIEMVEERRNAVADDAFQQALGKDGPEAEAAWRRYLLVSPESGAAYNNLGVALRDQGRYLEAEAAFREAFRLDPSDAISKANIEKTRRRPGYSAMLKLAQGAAFWSGLAADAQYEPMKWLSMKCFDDGCKYSQDHSRDIPLLVLAPALEAVDVPRRIRDDPRVLELQKERHALEKGYQETAEALKAVWSEKERAPQAHGALDLLEFQHKNALTKDRSAIRTKEIEIEKRYQDLGYVRKAG